MMIVHGMVVTHLMNKVLEYDEGFVETACGEQFYKTLAEDVNKNLAIVTCGRCKQTKKYRRILFGLGQVESGGDDER